MCVPHLSPQERYQIELGIGQGLSNAQIGLRLGRHRSTIWRERSRLAQQGYVAAQAQAHRGRCASRSAANAPRYERGVWQQVRRALAQRCWSPRQIAERARLQGRRAPSMQAIYGWVHRTWSERASRPLRRRVRRFGGPAAVFGWARAMQPIAQRPRQVLQRQELGHWEADSMLGSRGGFKTRLLVCVERASRYTRLVLLDNGLPETAAAGFAQGVLRAGLPLASVTVDRGSEFALLHTVLGHDRLYVCDARQPNQRGTNENTIGLVRQFIPKGEPLSLQTTQSIARIERLLNNRPRACLGFKTPAEVLSEMRGRRRDSN